MLNLDTSILREPLNFVRALISTISKLGDMAPNMEMFSTESVNTVQRMTKESPFFEPVVEDEFHVLNSCSRYVDAKTKNKD